MIGSQVGINAKWISTTENKIADNISRLKKSNASSFCYDFSKLKQDHLDLKHCRFYHPSQELLLLIWETVLTKKSPDLESIQALKQKGLGRLSMWIGAELKKYPTPAGTSMDTKKYLLASLKTLSQIVTPVLQLFLVT